MDVSEVNDLILALEEQRNEALTKAAKLRANVSALNRTLVEKDDRIKELEDRIANWAANSKTVDVEVIEDNLEKK